MAACFEHLARGRIWRLADGVWPKEGINGDGTVVSYLNNIQTTKGTTMKLTALAAFALSSTCAFARYYGANATGVRK